ncbi:MAG: JAB domain-containing protein [Candidatus Omnitrophota bacterium]
MITSLNFYSLKLVREKTEKYETEKNITKKETLKEIALLLNLQEEPEEVFVILTVNTKHRVVGVFEVSRGSLAATLIHPREVFKRALLDNASGIFCIHNHPSGDVTPSSEDIAATERLKDAGEILGIGLIDHLIAGENGCYSFKENGMI